MSVKKFKFISPGIFINEIDNSGIPDDSDALGPVIIGRAEKGPALRPVTVSSFSEFVEIFGAPVPGGLGGDVWREGNSSTPMHGTYAAQAWLRNSSPLTFVRLLGDQHTNAVASSYAGWETWLKGQFGTSAEIELTETPTVVLTDYSSLPLALMAMEPAVQALLAHWLRSFILLRVLLS